MMSNYEQPSTPLMPEKLPSIDKLPIIKSEPTVSPVSSPPVPTSMIQHNMNPYLPAPSPIQQQQYYNNGNMMYHQHMSPPLTPAVSPSSVLLDSMQFKRKFSVDVGPFGFGTTIPHPSSMQHDDAYRRSSCSSVSLEQQEYNHFMNVQQQQHYSPSMTNTTTMTQPMEENKSSRRGSRAQLSGPNTQHKHACKFSYCAWSFKRYEHLKRHMLVHTGKRPHVCHFPGCGKSFSRSDNFHAHYRTHTKKSNLLNGGVKKKGSNKTTNTAAAAAVASAAAAAVTNSHATATYEEDQSPAYFANKQQHQQFDITQYGDIYGGGHRHSYSEESNDFHQPQDPYLRNTYQHHFSLPQQQQAPSTSSPEVSSLLNHELNNSHHHSAFYSTEDRFNYGHHHLYSQPQQPQYNYHGYPTNNDNSSIAAAVAVVAAAASSSSSTTNTTTTSRRSSSTSSSTSSNNQMKSHICPVSQCQRRFKRLEHLKRHMRIHTLERPFGCSFPNCHKTFSRSDNLSQHMKTHQRVEDRRRRQQPMNKQQQSNEDNMMMAWHNSSPVGC